VWPDGIRRFGYREATIDTASTTDNFVLDVYTAAFLLKRNQEILFLKNMDLTIY